MHRNPAQFCNQCYPDEPMKLANAAAFNVLRSDPYAYPPPHPIVYSNGIRRAQWQIPIHMQSI